MVWVVLEVELQEMKKTTGRRTCTVPAPCRGYIRMDHMDILTLDSTLDKASSWGQSKSVLSAFPGSYECS